MLLYMSQLFPTFVFIHISNCIDSWLFFWAKSEDKTNHKWPLRNPATDSGTISLALLQGLWLDSWFNLQKLPSNSPSNTDRKKFFSNHFHHLWESSWSFRYLCKLFYIKPTVFCWFYTFRKQEITIYKLHHNHTRFIHFFLLLNSRISD